jgi:hypothetical protein
MRINGSGNLLPPNIARAYGVQGAAAARPAAQAVAPTASGALAQISPASPSINAGPINAGLGVNTAPGATGPQALVAGQVPGPITFDGVSVPRSGAGGFHMYTRAADKIEAAIAVQVGRTLDIKG